MTLNQAARVGGMTLFVILLTLAFLWGNQRLALAEGADIFSNFNALQEQAFSNDVPEVPPLPETNPDPDNLVEEELCKIYTHLNEAEFPIPGSDVEPCGGQGGEEPPPPPPPDGGGGGGGGGVENTLALCTDGIDNDGDSKVDLEDSDCASFRPKLTVTLVVVNDNDGTSGIGDFSLSANMSTPDSADSVGLSSGNPAELPLAGTWTLAGFQKTGYTATFTGDCNASGEITLAAGETKNCTITSNDVAPDAPACSDGIDNDDDELIDMADPGCSSPSDDDETNSGGGGTTGTPSSGGGGGGGGGGGWGGAASAAQATTSISQQVLNGAAASITSCDQYLTEFIREGKENTPEQVRRLQVVLREFEGMTSVEVNGVYDAATLAAVHVFQTKYASEILTPWGINESTGYVYLTTRKKVNEIYCNNTKLFPLTAAEQRIVERARAGLPPETGTSVQASSATSQAASAATTQGASETGTSTSQGAWWDPIGDFLRGIFRTPR